MAKKIIVTADDFGISAGVQVAVEKMVLDGRLNSVAIIAGAKYTQEAVDFCLKNPNVMPGVYFNLTSGSSVLGHAQLPTITDKNGEFKFGFIGLCVCIFRNRRCLLEIEKELFAQIGALIDRGVKVAHIASRDYVHLIPGIFAMVKKIAKRAEIQRIRSANESFLRSFLLTRSVAPLTEGKLLKLFVLKVFNLVGGLSFARSPYLFSIMYQYKITNDLIRGICVPFGHHEMEIVIYPGDPKIDATSEEYDSYYHLTSEYRSREAELSIKI